jgi:hypothetical protein
MPALWRASFDENRFGAAARISISREIHFGDRSVGINERADAFDDIKANFRNIFRAQPFQNRPAL